MIRSGFGLFHPAILLVVAAATMFAARQILSRILGSVDRTGTTIAYTAITSIALLTIPAIVVRHTPATC